MRRAQPEFRLQCAVADLLRKAALPLVAWTAVENGEKRDVMAAQRCARKGVRRGWPDLQLIIAGRFYGLELKTAKNAMRGTRKGILSPEQERVGGEIKAAGGVYAVAYGWDEAIGFLEKWGAIRPDRSLVRPPVEEVAA